MAGRRHHRSRRSASAGQDWVSLLAPAGQAWRLPLDVLLLTTLLFATFTYGATEAWSQQVVAGLSAAIAGYVLIACFVPSVSCRSLGSWTYLPIVAFLLLVVLQTVPLPAGVVSMIAPGTHEIRATLLADLDVADDAAPLSLLPPATWRQLWALLPIIAVFLAALHAYRSEAGVRRLCQILAVCGAAAAVYALYQNVGNVGSRFGGAVHEHLRSGPFLSHSHFGQYVNLGVGAALGLLFAQLAALNKRYPRPRDAWRKLLKDRAYLGVWLAAGCVVLGALAVLLSMTRGGVLAALLAGGAVGVLLAWHKPVPRTAAMVGTSGSGGVGGGDKAALLVGFGLIVVAVSLAVGFDQVYERLASLRHIETAEGDRMQILRDLVPAFTSYPLWGTGLGTFEAVFPKYDTTARASLTTHAENEYAHLLLETGVAGLLCIAAFVLIVFRGAWPVLRRPRRSLDFVAFGLMFGWLAVLLHSFTDFGQHVPAVALMTALTLAALLNLTALHRARPAEDEGVQPMPASARAAIEAAASNDGPRSLRWLGPVALAALALGGVFATARLEGPRQAAAAFAAGDAIRERIYGSDPELVRPGDDERMIRRYAEAAAADPSVPRYAYFRDFFAWGLIGSDDYGNPRPLADDPLAQDEARMLLESIDAHRVAAPTFGPTHALAGEARFLALGEAQRGVDLVETGHDLPPHDPYVAYTAGYLAARLGDHAAAAEHFVHATRLSPALRQEVVAVYVNEFDDPGMAYTFAAEELGALQELQRLIADDPDHAALAAKADADARAILVARAYADDAMPGDLTAMARRLRDEGDHDEAIALYQRAVALAPKQVAWRLELAELFAALGNPTQAVREARAVLQLRPASAAANRLLQEQVPLLGDVARTERPL